MDDFLANIIVDYGLTQIQFYFKKKYYFTFEMELHDCMLDPTKMQLLCCEIQYNVLNSHYVLAKNECAIYLSSILFLNSWQTRDFQIKIEIKK
jgi:hypothetical protein